MNTLEIMFAKVGHRRLFPKHNEFLYSVFYMVTPVTDKPLKTPRLFSFNRFNMVSLYTKDHGARDGTPWRTWITQECRDRDITVESEDTVLLISHPRILGFVFNPISFWIVYEKNSYVKAILCEVHNTFGDNHNYLLAHNDGRGIYSGDAFTAIKNLYVSPFNNMTAGHYRFRFDITDRTFKTDIDYFEGATQILEVYMSGEKNALTMQSLLGTVIRYPCMTLLVVVRIHWQAARLYFKGVKHTLAHRPKPTAGNTTHAEPEKKH